MNETLKLLLSLSLSGSILAILIFAMKPVIRHKLAKSVQYYIWLVVLLRLILPFSFAGSVMNEIFYSNQTPVTITSPGEAKSTGAAGENTGPSSLLPNVQENLSKGVYGGDTDHRKYFSDLFNQYALYLWLLGVMIIFATNLAGYIRFAQKLNVTNTPAAAEENRMLISLVKGGHRVKLRRNSFVATPMLMGILRPTIIIPDIDFNEKQLKNILLHELTHLSRFDIAVKWLAMLAVSLHWFNPLMYFIKKEINRACELSCDEAVIKNLNAVEKQTYGDTLISVVAEHKLPVGVLQATMCEEKTSLKERLVAIMRHKKKSKSITMMSLLILVAVIVAAMVLGAGVGETQRDLLYQNDTYGFTLTLTKDFAEDAEIREEPPVIYFVNSEIQKDAPDQIFGVVARIEVYDKKEFTRENLKQNEEMYGLKYLGENENYYFGWAHATDVQVPPGRPELSRQYRAMEAKFNDIIKTFKVSDRSGPGLAHIANRKRPTEPPSIIITASNAPITNYIALKNSWDGKMYDRPSFYQVVWDSEPTLLTGLHRPKPGEKFKLDFGAFSPDQISVQMAYLTESTEESLLPIVDVPVSGEEGIYEFINPPSSTSDIYTSGRCYSIMATWGDNSCEYVFATDGKFD